LKKSTKKLLLVPVRAGRISRVSQRNKSFLFLFFKKEILPSLPVGQRPRLCLALASAYPSDGASAMPA
jgi:hypothetical protein